jgi:hypothetical protein
MALTLATLKYAVKRVVKHIALLLLFVLVLLQQPKDAQGGQENRSLYDLSSDYIASIYRKIDFGTMPQLNPKVFEYAYRGYMHLLWAQKLNPLKQIITICDYSLSANLKRLWIIDVATLKVLRNTFVAHGQGTGEEFATYFSNQEDSHQSSLGFYVTGNTYFGDNGYSMYLHGMDLHYNDAAFKRSIVMHGADYVSSDFIKEHQRLGRSWGCPAVSNELAPEIIHTIQGGTCLFIYYPLQRYLNSSVWLQDQSAPAANICLAMNIPQHPDGEERLQVLGKQ